jgi:hypothetical protein
MVARRSRAPRSAASAALVAVVGALALASSAARAQEAPEAVLVNAIVTSFAAAAAPGGGANATTPLLGSANATAPGAAANATMMPPAMMTRTNGTADDEGMMTNAVNGASPAPKAEAASMAGGSTTAATLRAMLGSAASHAPKPFGGAVAGAVEAQTKGFVSGVAAKVAAGPSATDAKHPLSDALRANPLLNLIAPAADASYAAKQAVARAVETDALDKLRAFVQGSEVVGAYSRDALANYVSTVKALSAAAKAAMSGKADALNFRAADLKKSVVSLRDSIAATKGAASEELQRKAADAVVVADALGDAASRLVGGAADTAAAGLATVAAQGAAAADVYRAAEASAAAMLKATVARKAELLSAMLDKATAALRLLKMGTGPLIDKKLDLYAAGIKQLRSGLRMAVAAIEAAPVPSDLVASAKRTIASRDKPLLNKAVIAPAKKAASAVGKVVGAQDGGAALEAAGAEAAQSVDAALNGALTGLAERFRAFEGAVDDVKGKFGGDGAVDPEPAAASP